MEIKELEVRVEQVLKHLQMGYTKLQTGTASAGLVEGILVDSYGSMSPLKNVAAISLPSAMTINIQPWDKSLLKPILGALQQSLEVPIVDNGELLIINIPPLTQERRLDLVKIVHSLAEEARVGIRNVRQDIIHQFKTRADQENLSEDLVHQQEDQIQETVKKANTAIDDLVKHKEEKILQV